MGTLRHWGFDSYSEGATITAGTLLSDDGAAATVVSVTGTRIATADHAHGGMCARVAATGFSSIRLPFAAAGKQQAFSVYLYTAATPAAAVVPFNFQTAADTSIGPLTLATDGKITANSGAVQGTANITHGQLNRFDVRIDTVAGTLHVGVFAGDSTTAYSTLTWTGASFASASVVAVNFGSLNGATFTGWFDDPQLENARTSWIGPYLPAVPLDTPEPTLAAQTQATAGAANGTATVSWAPVDGATSYSIWLAAGASPAQGDYTQIASGITALTYTVTGLPVGVHTIGVRAD